MRIASVNVSLGREVVWQGQTVRTGIYKEPVPGTVLRQSGVDGDKQFETGVHGGTYKAVYAYALEDIAFWSKELGKPLGPGAVGENLTVEGMNDEELCVGDTLRVGRALLQAVQPRLPCLRLAVKFDDAGMIKRFLEAGRWGVYFSVLEEGDVKPGDAMTFVERDRARYPVPALGRLRYAAVKSKKEVARVLALKALPPEWRARFSEKS